jgi:hypothetical protein
MELPAVIFSGFVGSRRTHAGIRVFEAEFRLILESEIPSDAARASQREVDSFE